MKFEYLHKKITTENIIKNKEIKSVKNAHEQYPDYCGVAQLLYIVLVSSRTYFQEHLASFLFWIFDWCC
jgi:hypothetical protein